MEPGTVQELNENALGARTHGPSLPTAIATTSLQASVTPPLDAATPPSLASPSAVLPHPGSFLPEVTVRLCKCNFDQAVP